MSIKVRLSIMDLPGPLEVFSKRKAFLDSTKVKSVRVRYSSLYQGTKSPLIGYGLQCSLQFGFNRYFRKILADFNKGETEFTLLVASILTGIPSALSVVRIVYKRHLQTT